MFLDPASRDPERNGLRLLLRKKLEHVAERGWGVMTPMPVVRPSLTHPHALNHMKVSYLSINYGRSREECSILKKCLGDAAPMKADSPSLSLHAYVRLDASGLSAGLLLPAEAWWDFNALMADAGDIFALAKAAKPPLTLETPSWIQPETMDTLDLGQWRRVMKALQPGRHPFLLKITHGFGDNPIGFLASCRESLMSLFMAMKWKPPETNPI